MMNDEVLSKQDGNKPIGNVTKSIDSNEVTNIEYLYRTVMKKLNDGYESGMSVAAAAANNQANSYQRFSKENRHDSKNSPVMTKKKSTAHDSSQSFDMSDIRHCKRKNIHVKSRSGDSDYLYTDFLKSSSTKSGGSSKSDMKHQQCSSHPSTRKVSTPVSRSSSFHYGNKKTPNNDVMPNAVRDFNFRNFLDEMNASQQQRTDQQMSYRQFTQQHGVVQSSPIVDVYNLKTKSGTKDITEEGGGIQTLWSSNPTVEVDIIPTPSTPSTDMSQTPTAGKPQLNFRSQQGNNMLQNSSNFYQIHPTQDSPNQSFNGQQQQTQGSRSGHGIIYQGVPCDMSSTEFNTTTEGGVLHSSTTNLPQRPKTLALGQNTRSKSDCSSSNNNNNLISPSMSLPSPSIPSNHHQCTPLRNTLYYNTGVMDITPAYTSSRVQHPRQRSGGSITGGQISSQQQQQQQQHQQYLRRNGSAGNIVNPTSTPSAQTPSYPEYNFCETINGPINIRTPTSHPNFSATNNQQQTNNFDQGFALSGMNKCENNNPQRRMPNTAVTNNQYRNSGSFGYSSAGSGSSSNSGSRPNSHVDDFPHPLEIENESLRCQLKKVKHQLKMMQTIKKSLQLITDDYNSLHQSVSKREKLQNEVQKSLLNELDSCKKENRNLKGQLNHVQEQLIQNQMEYKNNGKNEEVQNESQKIISSYEAKNRQLEEKKRELDEELEECRKIMMEQQSEIVDLNNELSESRDTNCKLQEQLQFQTNCVNAATARDTKMEALQKTLQEQVYVEQQKYEELRRHHQYRQQQQQQQPHNNHQVVRSVPASASANEEGVGEVDHGFVETIGGSVRTPSVLSHDQLAVKAQKLKWRQVQLEEMLGFSAPTDATHGYNSTSSCSCRPGSSEGTTVVSYQHQHAASDPCFNKLPEYKFPAGEQRESATPPLHGAIFSSLTVEASNELANSEENQKPIQFDFACQTSQEYHHQQQQQQPNERANHQIDQEQRCSPQKKNHQQSSSQQTTGSMTSPAVSCHHQQQQQTRQTNTEGDSPASEGYHSQQSSGSPTPNSERSMSNFPVARGDHHVADVVARNSCPKATDV